MPIAFAPPGTPRRHVRARHFKIGHVTLSVRIDCAKRVVSGTVTHAVELLTHGSGQRSIQLDCHGSSIEEVSCGGETVPWQLEGGSLRIELPSEGRGPFNCRIRFRTERPLKGLFFIDPSEARKRVTMCWTQGAMEDHSWWFPCFDDPNNLSTYAVRVEHDASLRCLAGGVCEGREDRGATVITTFRQDRPHVLYLLNLCLGRFEVREESGGPVPIAHAVPAGRGDTVARSFAATGFALGWIVRFVGLAYPWQRYGHVAVHDFMWGGMENTTLTTITDRVLIDEQTSAVEGVDPDALVIHELVHQWFGDLVTMKGWSDIWLNESFATYLEARGLAAWRASRDEGREDDILTEELWANRAAYLAQETERYSRALVTDYWVDAYELFDRVAYEKGSLVLHALCRYLGERRFRACLQRYLEQHAHSLVETSDFRQACEDVTGEPLDWFFQQWLERPGHPRLKVRSQYDAGRRQIVLTVSQLQAADDATACYRLPCLLTWRGAGGLGHQRIELRQSEEVVVVACDEAPAWVCLDPEGAIVGEWDETGADELHLKRLADDQATCLARLRSAEALARSVPQGRVIAGLAQCLNDQAAARVLRARSAWALGELRGDAAQQALVQAWPNLNDPALRRSVAEVLAVWRGDTALAQRLLDLAEAEPSALTAGALMGARARLRVPGATAALRSRMERPSWNEGLRVAAVQGLGASGEAAAIDLVLALVSRGDEHEAVRAAAAAAAASLGAEMPMAVTGIRLALEAELPDAPFRLRAGLIKALGVLGDATALAALDAAQARERFGIIGRMIREAQSALQERASATEGQAKLRQRIDELEGKLERAERAIAALEKRLE
ncbi:MAG: M1 family aminopeptidase [Planctomycetota bacterium]|nr:M1 family aminopeptidase [Planctomycetota bacterium]